VTVDVLAEARVAGDHKGLEAGSAHVADQAGAAVADGDVRPPQRVGERPLVEEVLGIRDRRSCSTAVLDENLDVRARSREIVAPRDQARERMVVSTDEAEDQRSGHSSSPITVAFR
jgi:hypothetical protein